MFKTAGARIAELESVQKPLRRSAANEISIFASRELRLGEHAMVGLMLATQGSYDHASRFADHIVGAGAWSIAPNPGMRRQSPADGYFVQIGEISARSRMPALAIVAAVLKWALSARG